ncbi:MAG TPA: MOSC domain-containing protein [Solirubrobacteraceae bacterium]|jgi:hypothetical protein
MKPAEPPPDGSPLTRSVTACLASILESSEVPCPVADHPEPWTVWRHWLAGRGAGLVPVDDPAAFLWPGPWIAVLRGGVAAVAFGIPPGLIFNPLGGQQTFEDVRCGYVVAPLDLALWQQLPLVAPRSSGLVEAIALARDAEAAVRLVQEATARAGAGLHGDRYGAGRGTFSNPNAGGIDLTLIEAESMDALALDSGQLRYEDARRNIVTRGIDLNALVGERFAVGEVQCLGQRLCEPCAHLQRLTQPGTLRGLVHRGGLRADILAGGVIRVGDEIRRIES